jgi:hypothetical protein
MDRPEFKFPIAQNLTNGRYKPVRSRPGPDLGISRILVMSLSSSERLVNLR